ncbi:MAG TPA: sugar phosphate isomerase/epimerase, partial [Armatimonadota bacterium]|nr:sugar phosphate isomerase/epimerase [Armatimonadota bacterium]
MKMTLGLHAYSLVLAAGLREYRPVGRGVMTAADMLDTAKKLGLSAVQLARAQVATDDLVALANLGKKARDLGLALTLSTNQLAGEHLVTMIHTAHTLGAAQVVVGLCCLQGNVKERQRRLEALLADLDVAIKRAERYKIPLVFENGRHTASADLAAFIQAAQSDYVGACYDMGNALTVPEDPVDAAEILGPYCHGAHVKDLAVYRTNTGVMLVNCPVNDGALEIVAVLKALKARKPELTVFLQTAA